MTPIPAMAVATLCFVSAASPAMAQSRNQRLAPHPGMFAADPYAYRVPTYDYGGAYRSDLFWSHPRQGGTYSGPNESNQAAERNLNGAPGGSATNPSPEGFRRW
jgi:hypothetical protein